MTSDDAIKTEVEAVFEEECSFYQYADAIMRLVTRENVASVMICLPKDFRDKFLGHVEETYLPRGPRIVIGRALPDESLAAVRAWWSSTKPTFVRQEGKGGSQ